MPAVSEGPLLLAANFQGSGFNSFTFFIPTEKHFRKHLYYSKSVAGVLPGCKRQLKFLHRLIHFLCLLVGLSKQYLDLGIRDHAIENHAIRLKKQCICSLGNWEGNNIPGFTLMNVCTPVCMGQRAIKEVLNIR